MVCVKVSTDSKQGQAVTLTEVSGLHYVQRAVWEP